MNDFTNDILGKALYDYYNGEQNQKVIVHCNVAEDENLPVEYFFRDYNQMPEVEKIALNECMGKVLDAGAGSGCHALYLQEKKIDVTAIEISKYCIDIMQKRGIEKVILKDIFEIKNQKYDTILMLMNGIGMVKTIDGLKIFLEQIKISLNKGGSLIINSSDLQYLFTDSEGARYFNLLQYYGEIIYQLEYKSTVGKEFEWLYIDYVTLSDIATSLDFNCEILYEDNNFNYLAKISLN